MPSVIPCPACGKYHFHKSHTRNIYEKLRKAILKQRPYRCHECGYRGWVKYSVLRGKKTMKEYLIYLLVLIIAIFVSFLMKKFMV